MTAVRTCPKCGSTDLVFVEHSAAMTFYRCVQCDRVLAIPKLPPSNPKA